MLQYRESLPPAPSDFLGSLEESERDTLHALGRMRTCARGEFLFRVGDPGAHVYFLVQGRVKIFQPGDSGREVILWYCLPGEIFGLAEVAAGGGRVVNAHACEQSEVLSVPQEAFRGFVASRPRAALLSMQVLSARLRGLSDMVVNLVDDDVETRVAKLILRLGARYGVRDGDVVRLAIPLTHQEIADMVGTTRQTVTGVLMQLRRRGALSVDANRILIESPGLLGEVAQDAA